MARRSTKSAFIKRGMGTAEALCRQRRVRLTPVRRRVLELVLMSGKPIGAYKLLQALRDDGYSDAPPTVYRALEFLLAHGLVHRISKSNTFVACAHPGLDHYGLILLCRQCGGAVELEQQQIIDGIDRCADGLGFDIVSQVLEVEGTCRSCKSAS
ncbi:MAG: Fur family transcriptional regulator [Gammaproteobacteria bacterium]